MTTLKDALRDPKRLIKEQVYEAGGHRILAKSTLWTALSSDAWKAAAALGEKDPSRYYYKPERWILIAKWMEMLDSDAVTYLAQSVEEKVAQNFRDQAKEAGCEGTNEEVLALLGSQLVDLYSLEMLSTTTLEPVMTHQGFFKTGDFRAKRELLPNGGFRAGTTPPGSQSEIRWNVLEAALMALYSVGCIVTGEAPQLLVVHLGHEVTGREQCFAVTPLANPMRARRPGRLRPWARTLGEARSSSK